MIFLPYKLDTSINRLPILTLLVCILCVFVYWQQYSIDKDHSKAVEKFCYDNIDKGAIAFLRKIARTESGNQCPEIFQAIRTAPNTQLKIEELSKEAIPSTLFSSNADNLKYVHNRLTELFKQYDSTVPKSLTSTLAYDPKNPSFKKMLTSTFSHADIIHLAGNLLFFYIFAASVEIIVGGFVFSIFVLVTSVGTSLAYSHSLFGIESTLPTIGLSGVVMAAMTALAVMLPTIKIRCFFWFLVYIRVFRIPALSLAAWYIGWDIYGMKQAGNDSYINYVAHVSGAIIGGVLGIFCIFFRKETLNKAIAG
ncbi:MAG: rhomboid family intramembrane serine protease [Porticoccaceae bacterium]|nr:rhomboid family intramembrane serine protease [Pseudomonadales bacterium]MCP5173149.1 rhomboid family intramembrane serine protease [Pseudomonadales bacterium]